MQYQLHAIWEALPTPDYASNLTWTLLWRAYAHQLLKDFGRETLESAESSFLLALRMRTFSAVPRRASCQQLAPFALVRHVSMSHTPRKGHGRCGLTSVALLLGGLQGRGVHGPCSLHTVRASIRPLRKLQKARGNAKHGRAKRLHYHRWRRNNGHHLRWCRSSHDQPSRPQ